MRIETKEYKIYKYNELDEKVKEKINKTIEQKIIDDRFEWLKENLLEYLKEKHNISDCKLEYSFSYCQGDGCCFYGIKLLDYDCLKNKIDMNSFERFIVENYSPEEIGYKCYDVTPEEIEEFIDCMGYEFLEDGSIYE